MGSLRSTALIAALAFAAPATAVAATLDFASVCCDLVASPVTLPEATVTGISSFGTISDLLIDPEIDQGPGQPFPPFGEIWVCPVTYFSGYGEWCSGDLNIDFTQSVTNLKFDIGWYGSVPTVSVFTPRNILIASGPATLDLSHFGPIGRLFIEDTTPPYFDPNDPSTPLFEYGFQVANFSFDQQAVIPLPSTLVLLLGAFGLSGLFLRRSASPAKSRPLPS